MENKNELTNKILSDSNLSLGDKFIYERIKLLCLKEGKCWASNKWLAETFGTSESTIKRCISQLKKYNVISCNIVKKGKFNERVITLNETFQRVTDEPLKMNLSKVEEVKSELFRGSKEEVSEGHRRPCTIESTIDIKKENTLYLPTSIEQTFQRVTDEPLKMNLSSNWDDMVKDFEVGSEVIANANKKQNKTKMETTQKKYWAKYPSGSFILPSGKLPTQKQFSDWFVINNLKDTSIEFHKEIINDWSNYSWINNWHSWLVNELEKANSTQKAKEYIHNEKEGGEVSEDVLKEFEGILIDFNYIPEGDLMRLDELCSLWRGKVQWEAIEAHQLLSSAFKKEFTKELSNLPRY